jgi:outer membrane protein W
MKKKNLMIVAMLTLMISSSVKLNAQFEAGRKMIGLNMSYSSFEDNSGSNAMDKRKGTSMQLSPQFNYFFNNNISFGLGVMLLNSTEEDESSWIGNSKRKTSGFGFMVGSRIYSNNDHKLRFYANPQIGLMMQSGENEDLSPNPGPKQTMKSTNLGLIVGGGFTYMVSKNWGLDFGIGNLAALTSSDMEVKTEGVANAETSKSVDFTFAPIDLSSFTFGINYFF